LRNCVSAFFLRWGWCLIYRLGNLCGACRVLTLQQLGAHMTEQGSGGILGIVNLFAGGAFARASVFALGIMPYISASIAIQLLDILLFLIFRNCRKKEKAVADKLNQYTRLSHHCRYAVFQGAGYVIYSA
jgi:preprotein translocase subunit SecY